MTSHYSPRGKYVPLLQYLEALPADQQTVTLTFAEIEVLVGPLLPTAATLHTYWTSGSMARQHWQRAGFTASLDRLRSAVTFTRR